MKKRTKWIAALLMGVIGMNLLGGCAQPEEPTTTVADELFDAANGVTITADFKKPLDAPLLKKVAMYNAGCIQPLSNYERDFARITDLNADALRIDLSIGKSGGTGGQYLVGDIYESSGNAKDGYTIDPSSLKYDFSQLDSIVRYMTEYDIRPYMSWSYIPYPLQDDGKWNDLDQSVVNWREVWEEVYYQYAKHYVDAGIKIGYHEIYNEPDLEILKCWGVFDESFDGFLDWNDFCLGNQCAPGKGVYNDMYVYGVKGILRADPDATVGGPAFALGEIGVEDWVGFLSAVKNNDLPLDFYSFHTYLDGNTWFRPDDVRESEGPNEIEKVVQGLAKDKHFLTTAVHINEFSYLNDKNGSNDGILSPFNYYGGASDTLNGLMEAVSRTTVQWIYWAQFMESTGGYDPYGLIHQDGTVKAAYNALKAYMDMPVWRYEAVADSDDSGIVTLVSSTDDKIGILIWNDNSAKDENGNLSTAGDRSVKLDLANPAFAGGERRVYRIDAQHASSFDGTSSAELVAEGVKTVDTAGTVWTGTVPAEGVVYITINKDSAAKDFDDFNARDAFADDIKTQYYYEDRYRGLEGCRELYEDNLAGYVGSYQHFDRTCNTMYLGMGDSRGLDGKFVGQAHANGCITYEGIPEKFQVIVKTEGELKQLDKNSTLGMRVDFYDEATQSYTKSVYFHLDNFYRAARDPNAQDVRTEGLPFYPWGTQKAPDVAVSMSGEVWDIDLSQYAPDGWNAENGRVQISFDMQNMGEHTRATFTLSK